MLRRLAAGVALVVALALAGCTPPEPTESTTPVATPSSESPSDEDLLVEARTAWDAYRDRLDDFGADPSTATREGLLEVATPEVADALLVNFEDAAERRLHTEGTRETTAFEVSDFSSGPASLQVSVCVDLSGERYIGDEGTDLTPPDRPNQRGSLVDLVRAPERDNYLIAGEAELALTDPQNPCD